jgi:hypothetical protein
VTLLNLIPLYISVVIKGNAMMKMKRSGMHPLMEKYQKKGKYESLDS